MAGVAYGWGSGPLTKVGDGWRRWVLNRRGTLGADGARGIRLASPRLVESEWHAAVMDRLDALRLKYVRPKSTARHGPAPSTSGLPRSLTGYAARPIRWGGS